MPEKTRGGNLFIVDNSDSDWKVRDYLREWSGFAYQFDIATGSFEIGRWPDAFQTGADIDAD